MKRKKIVFKVKLIFFLQMAAMIIYKELQRVDMIVMKQKKVEIKNRLYINLLVKWLRLYHQKKEIVDYFTMRNIKRIAVYGNGQIGKIVQEVIEKNGVDLCYIIDKDYIKLQESVPVYGMIENLPYVDLIIVTVIEEYEKIRENLKKICAYNIESIETIIDELQ